MDGKTFFQYLIEINKLTISQLKEYLAESVSSKKTISEILIEKGCFTSETLPPFVQYFIMEQKEKFSTETEIDFLLEKKELGVTREELLKLIQTLYNEFEQAFSHESSTLPLIENKKSSTETNENTTELFGDLEQFANESKASESEGIAKTQLYSDSEIRNNINLKKENRYKLLETLGQGGMGVVQLVNDNYLGRDVALKRIRMRHYEDKELTNREKMLLSRLHKEASITAVLEHPNIIPVHDMQEEENGELYFTMRKVEGKTLREILRLKREKAQEDKEYDETKLFSIFFKICDAVAYAHSQKIIHRDLKPENIMIGPFGEVYVMDWGIAKQQKDHAPEKEESLIEALKTQKKIETSDQIIKEGTETIGGMGTEGYMPPEQREDASTVTTHADIYALGKVLRECFTLHSPMEELNLRVEEHQKSKGKSNALDMFDKDIPQEILAIIDKATKEKREERYQNIQDFTQDLVRYQRNMKVSVKSYSPLEATFKWVQRNKEKVALALVLFFLCCGFYFYLEKEKENEFQKHFKEAKQKIETATKIKNDGKLNQGKKIEEFLYALNFLNYALYLKPDDKTTENSKLEVGEKIIELSCLSKDYQLATYIARDLQKLSLLQETKGEDGTNKSEMLLERVKEKQTKQERANLAKVIFWEKRFKDGKIAEGENLDVVYELSKMSEEKVFEKFLQIFDEGANYFIKNKPQDVNKEELYFMIIEVLGRSENKKAIPFLHKTLEQFSKKVFANYSGEKLPFSSQKYLISLIQSLANLKAQNSASLVRSVREKFETGDPIWDKTQLASKKLDKGLLKYYEKELSDNPKDVTAYFDIGTLKHDNGNYKEAIRNFSLALKLAPQDFRAYNFRGLSKQESGDIEGALKDYNQAIKINPEYTDAYTNRGVLKSKTGNHIGAIEDYNRIIALGASNYEIYSNRSVSKHDMGDLKGALEDCDQAIKLNPKDARLYNNRASVKSDSGDIEGAIQDYTKAIQLLPQESKFYCNRGMDKLELNKTESALLDFTQAIKLNPQYSPAYYYRGIIKLTNEDFRGAIGDLNRSIKLTPQNPLPYRERAVARIQIGKIEEALADFAQVIKLDPESPGVYYERGFLKYDLKDLKGSKEDFRQFLKFAKGVPEAEEMCQDIFEVFPELKSE